MFEPPVCNTMTFVRVLRILTHHAADINSVQKRKIGGDKNAAWHSAQHNSRHGDERAGRDEHAPGRGIGNMEANAFVQGTAFALAMIALLFWRQGSFSALGSVSRLYWLGGALGLVITLTVMLGIKKASARRSRYQ